MSISLQSRLAFASGCIEKVTRDGGRAPRAPSRTPAAPDLRRATATPSRARSGSPSSSLAQRSKCVSRRGAAAGRSEPWRRSSRSLCDETASCFIDRGSAYWSVSASRSRPGIFRGLNGRFYGNLAFITLLATRTGSMPAAQKSGAPRCSQKHGSLWRVETIAAHEPSVGSLPSRNNAAGSSLSRCGTVAVEASEGPLLADNAVNRDAHCAALSSVRALPRSRPARRWRPAAGNAGCHPRGRHAVRSSRTAGVTDPRSRTRRPRVELPCSPVGKSESVSTSRRGGQSRSPVEPRLRIRSGSRVPVHLVAQWRRKIHSPA